MSQEMEERESKHVKTLNKSHQVFPKSPLLTSNNPSKNYPQHAPKMLLESTQNAPKGPQKALKSVTFMGSGPSLSPTCQSGS